MSRDLRATTAFDVLEAGAQPENEILLRPSGVTSDDGELLFGLDNQHRRHLLVPAAERRVAEDRRSAGVQIAELTLVLDGENVAYADIICLLPELNAVFDAFVEDVLDAADGTHNPAAIANAMLERWRRLLVAARHRRVSPEKVTGIIGELIVLARLAADSPSITARNWTGPHNARHDIELETTSIEVKTTTSPERRVVSVHGLTQLEVLPDKDLLLILVRLVSDPEGDVNLTSCVDRLVLNGLSTLELHRNLELTGIHHADLNAYDDIRFTLAGVEGYRPTDPDFPRLTPDSLRNQLPPGIDSVVYTANLDVVQDHIITGDDLDRLMEGL